MGKNKAELKKAFLLYHDYYPNIKELTDNQLGKLLRAIFHHELNLEEVALDPETRMAFNFMAADLKRNAERYEDSVRKKSEAGKKGMEKRWRKEDIGIISVDNRDNNVIGVNNKDNNDISEITEITVNDNEAVVVNDSDDAADAEIDDNPETNVNSEADDEVSQQIVELYNSICTNLNSMKHITSDRKTKILNLLTKYSVDEIKTVFQKTNESIFLNDRDWKVTIDWILKEENFVKILEGKFDNTAKQLEKQESNKKLKELEAFYVNGG